MSLLAWFRLKYPEGKIACSVAKERDCFVATARIYCSYKDSPDEYISEATVSRSNCEDKPSVSPREWVQTAAISMALRNAGFGLQFDMVSDDFSSVAPNEFEENQSEEKRISERPTAPDRSDALFDDAVSAVSDAIAAAMPEERRQTPPEPSLDEKFKAACSVPCPIKKFEGRTLGDLINLDPKALKWIAEKFEGNPDTKAAALMICEYAMLNAG